MRREGIPLYFADEPKKLSTDATCSEVFEYTTEDGKKYVYKIVQPYSRIMHALEMALTEEGKDPPTLQEKAVLLNRMEAVVKDHYGDQLVTQHHIIANDEKGRPCIMKIQKKQEGIPLYQLKKDDQRYAKAQEQLARIREKIPKVQNDPRVPRGHKYRYLIHEFRDIDHGENIIVDDEGNLSVIDW